MPDLFIFYTTENSKVSIRPLYDWLQTIAMAIMCSEADPNRAHTK